jgi:hypothetical protein
VVALFVISRLHLDAMTRKKWEIPPHTILQDRDPVEPPRYNSQIWLSHSPDGRCRSFSIQNYKSMRRELLMFPRKIKPGGYVIYLEKLEESSLETSPSHSQPPFDGTLLQFVRASGV